MQQRRSTRYNVSLLYIIFYYEIIHDIDNNQEMVVDFNTSFITMDRSFKENKSEINMA